MRIGVLGTGAIIATIAPTLARIPGVERYAIASRTPERAKAAAAELGFEKHYGSYEALAGDPAVELIYIATPHSRHFEDMKLCIERGKPVLCEKPFTLNARQAREIKALAAEKGVFAAEAIWTRYMPSRQLINDTLKSGIIGNVSALTANLCYPISWKARIMAPELAGGALLDLGVYGLNFAYMHFGADVTGMESSVQFTQTGVDGMESITLFYGDGRMAVLTHGIHGQSDRKGIFYGDQGYLVVENINNPQSIEVFDTEDRLLRRIDVPEQISGYEYQFIECMEMLKAGEKESKSMPLSETVFVMEAMDALREQWGLVYPQEAGAMHNA